MKTLQPGWRVATCVFCGGQGVKWSYTQEQPVECDDCNGGTLYISPKGRRVLYPGGPFLGGDALDEEIEVSKPFVLEVAP